MKRTKTREATPSEQLIEETKSIIRENTSGKVELDHIRIVKAKIKSGNFLEAEYEVYESIKNKKNETEYKAMNLYTFKGQRYIHHDLAEAFERLTPHMALICEQVNLSGQELLAVDEAFESGTIHLLEPFTKFKCNGISIGGNDEHEGVVFIGRKNLKRKRVLNLTSPFHKFSAGEHEEAYIYEYYLNVAVSKVVEEVREHIINGKCGIDPNESMFNESEEQDRTEG
jgi:hypothetical protein